MTKQDSYIREINELVSSLYFEAERLGYDLHDLAERSGLSFSTVYRIAYWEVNRPQARTIMLLAKAVGWRIVAEPKAQRLRIAG